MARINVNKSEFISKIPYMINYIGCIEQGNELPGISADYPAESMKKLLGIIEVDFSYDLELAFRDGFNAALRNPAAKFITYTTDQGFAWAVYDGVAEDFEELCFAMVKQNHEFYNWYRKNRHSLNEGVPGECQSHGH